MTIYSIYRTVLDVGHALDEELLRDAESLAEFHGVQSACLLVHDDHDVVSRLVIDEQFAVSVGDDAARGVLNLFQEGIRVGIFLVVVAQQLKREQAHDVDDDNQCRHATNHITSVAEVEIHDRKPSVKNGFFL